MNKLSRFFLCNSILFLFSFFLVQPAHAMEFRTSEKSVTVAENELIDGTLFAAGNTVEIDGSVDGDVFCAGQTITIKGSVTGDVLCAGQTIRIEGPVEGSVRIAGQSVDVTGIVERSVTLAGQTIMIGEESAVGSDAIMGGETVSVLGDIGKGVLAGAGTVNIAGSVEGDARIAGNTINIGEMAYIGGTLSYQSDGEARIADGATVGQISKLQVPEKIKNKPLTPKPLPMRRNGWPVSAGGSIAVALVLGAIGVLLFRQKFPIILDTMKARPGLSMLYGLIWVAVFPVCILLLIITIIGIPLAVVYVAVFVCSLYIAKLVTALLLGREILLSFWKGKSDQWYLAMGIGVVLSWLVFSMPFIGWLATLFAILWGTGGMISAITAKAKKNR